MPGHIVRLLCGLNDHYCFFLKTHIEVIDKIREGHHGFYYNQRIRPYTMYFESL